VPGIFHGEKDGQCVGLTTLPLSCADCLEIWEFKTHRTLRAVTGLWWHYFTFTFTHTDTWTATSLRSLEDM